VRVVLDVNVIVSSLISSGTTAAVLDAWLVEQSYEPIVCPTLLLELEAVLFRPKFALVDRTTRVLLLERLRREAEFWADPAVVAGETRDPEDDYLVALARESGADVLVSGDSDLTQSRLEGVAVLVPAAFLDLLKSEDNRSS